MFTSFDFILSFFLGLPYTVARNFRLLSIRPTASCQISTIPIRPDAFGRVLNNLKCQPLKQTEERHKYIRKMLYLYAHMDSRMLTQCAI